MLGILSIKKNGLKGDLKMNKVIKSDFAGHLCSRAARNE